jgi:hypothetical protein
MRRHRTTIIRRRAPNGRSGAVGTMDDRAGPHMDALKGLLGKQLASIADTLVKASQRRDAEVKKKSIAKTSIASVAATLPPPTPPSTRPSLTSENEGTGSSDHGDILVFRGNYNKSEQQNRAQFDLGLEEANIIMGWIDSMPTKVYEPLTNNLTDDVTPRGSPRGGSDSDDCSDDDDPKAILHASSR